MRVIDAHALESKATYMHGFGKHKYVPLKAIQSAPTLNDLLPVTSEELKHMINDIIAYTWQLEERNHDCQEFGYDSRKQLIEKLKQFEAEHFPKFECCSG